MTRPTMTGRTMIGRTMITVVGAAFVGCRIDPGSRTGSEHQAGPVLETKSGRVRGARLGGVNRFLGIPYAQNIGGRNRFAPPRPVEPWTGVHEAVRYANSSPQQASDPTRRLRSPPPSRRLTMAMPSATSLLLNTVPEERSGTASGVLNTSRQVGGATAIAAFGALIAGLGYDGGLETSLVIAGALLVATMLASLRLRHSGP